MALRWVKFNARHVAEDAGAVACADGDEVGVVLSIVETTKPEMLAKMVWCIRHKRRRRRRGYIDDAPTEEATQASQLQSIAPREDDAGAGVTDRTP